MTKEYKIDLIWKWVFGLSGTFMLLLSGYEFQRLSADIHDVVDLIIHIYLTLFFLFFGLFLLYRSYFERVVISSTGIQYYVFGYSIRTDWEKLMRMKGQLGRDPDDFYLIYSMDNVQKWFWLPKFLIPRKKTVPFHLFSNNWRDSELGQQIKQHAPHLFQ